MSRQTNTNAAFAQRLMLLLGVILVILKACGASGLADVSWFLVLLPFYFWYAVVALFALFLFFVWAIVGTFIFILSLFE